MPDFSTILQIASVIGAIAFFGYLAFQKKWRARHSEYDEENEKLANIYKAGRDELALKLVAIEKELTLVKKDLNELRKENDWLRAVLQGRDQESIAFRDFMKNAVERWDETQADIKDILNYLKNEKTN